MEAWEVMEVAHHERWSESVQAGERAIPLEKRANKSRQNQRQNDRQFTRKYLCDIGVERLPDFLNSKQTNTKHKMEKMRLINVGR